MVSPAIFFFTAPATPEIYTLSLHDALPISSSAPFRPTDTTSWPMRSLSSSGEPPATIRPLSMIARRRQSWRSEEHTSELQSRGHLVCRLLLEKKKKHKMTIETAILQQPQKQ